MVDRLPVLDEEEITRTGCSNASTDYMNWMLIGKRHGFAIPISLIIRHKAVFRSNL